MKRRLARALSVLAVAILLGHLVQTLSENATRQSSSSAPASADPNTIVPVAAGPQAAVAPPPLTGQPVVDAPATPKVAVVVPMPMAAPAPGTPAAGSGPSPVLARVSMLGVVPVGLPGVTLATGSAAEAEIRPAVVEPTRAIAEPDPAIIPPVPAPAIVATTAPEPSIVPKAMEVLLQPESSCQDEMDLAVVDDAIIEISFLAPCRKGERLVLRHGGLAVTAVTTADGTAFLKIPALDVAGEVSIRFADGVAISGAVGVPEAAGLRRFAVQWIDRDSFAVNAFESGAGYGAPGHVSAANPGKLPLTGSANGGYLMILGDAAASPAMLAEVYTYPDITPSAVEISIEAEVTPDTCGRELLGEVITSDAGAARVSDLTLAMPDCGAIGDILVLKNPVQDLTLAAAN